MEALSKPWEERGFRKRIFFRIFENKFSIGKFLFCFPALSGDVLWQPAPITCELGP